METVLYAFHLILARLILALRGLFCENAVFTSREARLKAQARHPSDAAELRRRIALERSAVQRDRLRAVLLAIEGDGDGREMSRERIARTLGRSRQFIDAWVGRYRRLGLQGLERKKAKGNPPSLTPDQQAAFKTRLRAGPTEADGGVCTLRGKDAQRILAAEFGVALKLSAVYDWMHRLGLSCLRPRPRHRKNDPEAMKRWLADAPLLSKE
jgi:transposase